MFSNPSKPKKPRKTLSGTSNKTRKAGSDFSQQDRTRVKRVKKENTPSGSLPRVRTSRAPAEKIKAGNEPSRKPPVSSSTDKTTPSKPCEPPVFTIQYPPATPEYTSLRSQPSSQPRTIGDDEASIDSRDDDSTYMDDPEDTSEDDEHIDDVISDEDCNTSKETQRDELLLVRNRLIRMKMQMSWSTLRGNLANEADLLPVDVANRTMMGLLTDRELDITRYILMNGDTSYARTASRKRSAIRRYNNLVSWPATDLYRYFNDFPLDEYKAMGIYPQDNIDSKHELVSIEEPGDELDSQRMNMLYNNNSNNDDDSNECSGRGEAGYTGTHDISPDTDPIADPTLNGGIGLVMKRKEPPNTVTGTYCEDDVQILTRNHITNPWLSAPRYSRVPLKDELLKSDTIADGSTKQLIDMTRIQVLNQILGHRARSNGPASSEPLPLSKFVSSTVAEEAVGGISRTWSKLNEMLLNGVKTQSMQQPYPGTAFTQWYSVLEAALAAGLPPKVVARSYRRLEKLCEVTSRLRNTSMADIATKSQSYAQRKYSSRKLDDTTASQANVNL